jgi:hypothetical protein
MAREAQIQASLSIRTANNLYQSQPSSFQADVDGDMGPTPGAITVSTDGTDVDLSELDHPGLCWIYNLDPDNYVKVGRFDPDTNRFYPLMRVLPGECYVIRLDEDVQDEYLGTGTGTLATASTLRIKANNAAAKVRVEAFEA